MRKIILFMHQSLDGFVADANGELDWCTMNDDEMGKYLISDLLTTVDAMVSGRVLYQGFYQYWPAMVNNPSIPKELADFARWVDDSPKFVFSKTLDKVEWKNSTLLKGNLAQEVAKLKQLPGKDIVLFGGVQMAAAFVAAGLVDEYRFKIEPVVLGSGKSLWKDVKDRFKLKLTHSKTFQSGVMGAYYEPVKK